MTSSNIFYNLFRHFTKALKNFLSPKNPPLENIHLDPTSILNIEGVILKDHCIVSIGTQSQISGSLVFDRENASISIGDRVFMNGTLIASQNIELGNDILIAWGTVVVDHNSHSISFSKRANDVVDWQQGKKDWSHVKIKSVKICSKAWIGFNAIILKGVTIGEGAVVSAGSVVTNDVPPWTIVAGNPAKVIGEIPTDER